ncbi:hypothetical protein BIW11_03369 [Tropilaelaps mercedesae]|uniref:Uncharacterized protein n=1 Tax=Tropilaelaps mercedesae TaxID=418985 RepID=A0A1V9XMW3_9ACAR|nr:hypothetical protein BIW11_03369 [Tropilaelaps mercedesae]
MSAIVIACLVDYRKRDTASGESHRMHPADYRDKRGLAHFSEGVLAAEVGVHLCCFC